MGHSLISAGRPVLQDLEVIDKAINNHTFFKNQVLKGCFDYAKKKNSNIHLLGMISEGGIHSHLDHLLALLEMANRENFDRVYIDAITDGTDSEPMQALELEFQMLNFCFEGGDKMNSSFSEGGDCLLLLDRDLLSGCKQPDFYEF